jgi:hypothetical protein
VSEVVREHADEADLGDLTGVVAVADVAGVERQAELLLPAAS